MFATLSFVMLSCLFADLSLRRGGDVVDFVKSKF